MAAVQYRRMIKADHERPRLYMELASDPETGVVRDQTAPVSGPFTVRLSFATGFILHQPVTGLTIDEIAITNGTKTDLVQERGNGLDGDYEVTITPESTYTGPFTITVEEGAAYACADLDDLATCDEGNLSLGDTLVVDVVATNTNKPHSHLDGKPVKPNKDDELLTRGRTPPDGSARGCEVEVTVRFRDEGGNAVSVAGLEASDFTVTNGRLGEPAASADGLLWTVPGWAKAGYTGLMRVRLSESEGWIGSEQVFRVSGDGSCAPAGRGELRRLGLDGMELEPGFSGTVTAYTARALAETEQVTVTAAAVYGASSVAVAPGDADTGTEGHQVALAGGENEITATVTPGDGSAAKTYTVTVTRAEDPDAAAALSVADARAEEGPGAALDFAVTLDREPAATVTVEYETSDGTAVAGADYTATNGTLTFTVGETEKTVSVPVLGDQHDEGEETLTLTLTSATGATIADGEATGTIANSDPIPAAWTARFGRTVTGQVLEAVEARLRGPRAAGSKARLAGQALPMGRDGGDGAAGGNATTAGSRAGAEERVAAMTSWLARAGADPVMAGSGAHGGETGPATGGGRWRALTARDFVTGTSFTLSGGSEEGGGFGTVWGRGAVAGFDGRVDDVTVDGEVTSGFLGADWAAEGWRAGAALGHSRGTGDYGQGGRCGENPDDNCSGGIEATLTGLYPYAGIELTERLSAWAAAGHGAGEVTVTPRGGSGLVADLTMSMGAAGVRGEVLGPGAGGGLALAVKGDARFTRTSSDAVSGDRGNLEGSDADVWLVRAGVEGSRRIGLGRVWAGASVTPSFELGLRLDGGDAETGFGADVGGGIAFAGAGRGLRFEGRARGLVAHEAEGFREWGAAMSLGWDPRPRSERGFSLSLRQSWGASPTGGMDALLSRETLAGLVPEQDGAGFEASSRLEAEAGYGFAVFGGRFTGTPYLGVGLSESGRDWRIGWRLKPARRMALDFALDIEATRSEHAGHDANPEHGVMLRGSIRW